MASSLVVLNTATTNNTTEPTNQTLLAAHLANTATDLSNDSDNLSSSSSSTSSPNSELSANDKSNLKKSARQQQQLHSNYQPYQPYITNRVASASVASMALRPSSTAISHGRPGSAMVPSQYNQNCRIPYNGQYDDGSSIVPMVTELGQGEMREQQAIACADSLGERIYTSVHSMSLLNSDATKAKNNQQIKLKFNLRNKVLPSISVRNGINMEEDHLLISPSSSSSSSPSTSPTVTSELAVGANGAYSPMAESVSVDERGESAAQQSKTEEDAVTCHKLSSFIGEPMSILKGRTFYNEMNPTTSGVSELRMNHTISDFRFMTSEMNALGSGSIVPIIDRTRSNLTASSLLHTSGSNSGSGVINKAKKKVSFNQTLVQVHLIPNLAQMLNIEKCNLQSISNSENGDESVSSEEACEYRYAADDESSFSGENSSSSPMSCDAGVSAEAEQHVYENHFRGVEFDTTSEISVNTRDDHQMQLSVSDNNSTSSNKNHSLSSSLSSSNSPSPSSILTSPTMQNETKEATIVVGVAKPPTENSNATESAAKNQLLMHHQRRLNHHHHYHHHENESDSDEYLNLNTIKGEFKAVKAVMNAGTHGQDKEINENEQSTNDNLKPRIVKLTLFHPPSVNSLNSSFNDSNNQYGNQNFLAVIGTNSKQSKNNPTSHLARREIGSGTSNGRNGLHSSSNNHRSSHNYDPSLVLTRQNNEPSMSLLNSSHPQRSPKLITNMRAMSAAIPLASNNNNGKPAHHSHQSNLNIFPESTWFSKTDSNSSSRVSDFATPNSTGSSRSSAAINPGGTNRLTFLKANENQNGNGFQNSANSLTSFFNTRSRTFANIGAENRNRNSNNNYNNRANLTLSSINQLLALKDLNTYLDNATKTRAVKPSAHQILHNNNSTHQITKISLKPSRLEVGLTDESDFKRTSSALPLLGIAANGSVTNGSSKSSYLNNSSSNANGCGPNSKNGLCGLNNITNKFANSPFLGGKSKTFISTPNVNSGGNVGAGNQSSHGKRIRGSSCDKTSL